MTKEKKLQEYWVQIFICLRVVQNCSYEVANKYMQSYKENIEEFFDDGLLPNEAAFAMIIGV